MTDRTGETLRCALLALLGVFAAALPRALEAQTGAEPNLVFSISFGLTTGQNLWAVPVQPLIAPGGAEDTVGLARVLRPGLTGIVGATLFRSPNFGFTAEVGYYGIASEQRCSPPAVFATDPENLNQQACSRAQGEHKATSVVGFQVGGLFRFNPGGRVQPFVRATAGLGLIGNTFVETTGAVVVSGACSPNPCQFQLLAPDNDKEVTWLTTFTAGVSVALAPAYRLRMELRDVITSLPVATGPGLVGAVTPTAPTSTRVVHVPTFLFGIDLVFERRHTRRY